MQTDIKVGNEKYYQFSICKFQRKKEQWYYYERMILLIIFDIRAWVKFRDINPAVP